MTKKISIWVPICKEKKMKNSGKSDFRHKEDSLAQLASTSTLQNQNRLLCLALYVLMQPHKRLRFRRLLKADPTSSASSPRNVPVHNITCLYAMTQYWISKHFNIPVEINGVINIKAMLNTGAMANFTHQDLVMIHGIQTIPKTAPLTTKDIHGWCDKTRDEPLRVTDRGHGEWSWLKVE